MIYRIKCYEEQCKEHLYQLMRNVKLKSPDLENPRAHFWFTEKGWDDMGRGMAKELERRGFEITVKGMKTPSSNCLQYADYYQVAILGGKKCRRD